MSSAFRDNNGIELDELHTSEQEQRIIQMPKNTTGRPSEDSLKSNVEATVTSVMTGDDITMETQKAERDRRNFAIGILLLLLVVFLWTSSNFITQVRTLIHRITRQKLIPVLQDLFEEGFDKPFLVTYLNTSSFTIYLIPSLYRYLRRRSKSRDLPYDYLPVADEPVQVGTMLKLFKLSPHVIHSKKHKMRHSQSKSAWLPIRVMNFHR